jgi:hypothetical protein
MARSATPSVRLQTVTSSSVPRSDGCVDVPPMSWLPMKSESRA